MAEAEYKVRKAEEREQLPEIDLLPLIPHNGENLDVAVFGTNTYRGNLGAMQKRYFHSGQLQNISFRPATTSESISAAAYGFKDMVKLQIFDPRWLQVGYIVRTPEGVFTNTTETDGGKLKQLLTNARKVNGIYFLDNNIAFAPYETFESGVQDFDVFSQGGLARALEHTSEKTASKLRGIASPEHYKRGVNVWEFNPTKEPVVKVASLDSYRNIDGDRLYVDGDNWDVSRGFAFGVRQGEARTE